jgi:D-tyrosyl-tRNA(Tyr) deacylase
MRVVVQRVQKASVTVEGTCISSIGPGLLILLGVEASDEASDGEWLANKLANMRIHEDEAGLMNRSLLDTGGEALVVSQFTLHASTRKGNRPSFIRAAKPDHSEPLYEQFCATLETVLGKPVGRGRFGAMMEVSLVNDGPVTIVMDSKARE